MKKHLWMVFVCLSTLCVLSPALLAGTYKSDLGYTFEVPDGWTILNKDSVRDKPEMIDAAASAARDQQDFQDIPMSVLSRIKELAAGGQIDYFHSPDPRFTISVYRERAKIPERGFDQREACRELSTELAEQNARDMQVYECAGAVLDGHPGLRMVVDDYWKDRKYIQYMVRVNEEAVLIFTANTREKNFQKMKQDFEQILKTVEIEG